MKLAWLGVVACAACNPTVAQVTETFPNQGRAVNPYNHVVIGGPIELALTWEQQRATIKTDGPARQFLDTDYHYQGKPYRYEVACSAACDVDHPAGISPGWAHVVVTPRALGPLEISVTMVRVDTHEIKHEVLSRVQVSVPDHLKLECMDIAEGHQLRDCSVQPVPASQPWIRVTAYLDAAEREPVHSTELLLDGRAWPWPAVDPTHDSVMSLADVFGRPLVPGAYPIRLELRGAARTFTVTVSGD